MSTLTHIAVYQGHIQNKIAIVRTHNADILRFQERLFNALQNGVPDMISVEDDQGQLMFAINPSLVSLVIPGKDALNVFTA